MLEPHRDTGAMREDRMVELVDRKRLMRVNTKGVWICRERNTTIRTLKNIMVT